MLVAPLLLESGWKLTSLCSPIVVIDAPEELQAQRLITRDGVSTSEAAATIATQMPRANKRERADIVISNDGTNSAAKIGFIAALHYPTVSDACAII